MKRWCGRWMIGVAAIHTLFAVVVFWDILQDIAARGVFDSVGEDPTRGAVSWFVLCGFFLAILGLAVDAMERVGQRSRAVGVALLLTSLFGIILMPASGIWLLLPPAIAMLSGRGTSESQPGTK